MPGARLNVPVFLSCTRTWFQARNEYRKWVYRPEALTLTQNGVSIPEMDVTATHAFFCQGAAGRANPWFPGQPDRPVRGEILRCRLNHFRSANIVCGDHWIAPALAEEGQASGTNEFLVGATYDRDNLVALQTESARRELVESVKELTGEEPQVVAHRSGVRAATRDRRIVVRRHAEFPQLFVVNGLGSRGSLLAPLAASTALSLVKNSGRPPERTTPVKSITQMVHNILRRKVGPGDRVLDATAGNGHDTLLLAELAGSKNVTAIDIQDAAIQSARERLEKAGHGEVTWIQDDHGCAMEGLSVQGKAWQAIVFNLGYLPGGSRQLDTKPSTTRQAVEAGYRMLNRDGVMTVAVYRGHSGGDQEDVVLQSLMAQHPTSVTRIPGNEEDSSSPVLYIFRKS